MAKTRPGWEDVRQLTPEPAPSWWPVSPTQVTRHFRDHTHKGSLERLCRSAGGRDVWLYRLGKGKPTARTANYSAAMGSSDKASYFGKQRKDYRQTLLVLCGVHGMETEAVAGAVNLLHILESGRDLRGRRWPELKKLASKFRLLLVPLANPDGRARTRIPSLIGLTTDDLTYYGQGMWKTGEIIGWSGSKRFLPLPLEKVRFSGGYPNDDGVNLMHDVSPAGHKARETTALLRLVEDEIVDTCLNMHGHQRGPLILPHAAAAPDAYFDHTTELAERLQSRLQDDGLRPMEVMRGRRGLGYNLPSAMHFTSGCLSLTFETPQGVQENPYTYDELLDIQLLTFEETMRFGVECRFRPDESSDEGGRK
ncbi:MAG: hypothetical protein HN796_21200 [Gemmatimonadetes bacterium]|nr:hypothetical protein [Gemmatimonadota bacterium]